MDFEHKDFIKRINPEKTIARNFALRENMFTMYVAIVNRIPLFLTGSPGQSKTLSMNKILDGLKNSEN
jgi:E3 ubiquitin-protein ligase RNF213